MNIEEKRQKIRVLYCIRLLNKWFNSVEAKKGETFNLIMEKPLFNVIGSVLTIPTYQNNIPTLKPTKPTKTTKTKPIYKNHSLSNCLIGKNDYILYYTFNKTITIVKQKKITKPTKPTKPTKTIKPTFKNEYYKHFFLKTKEEENNIKKINKMLFNIEKNKTNKFFLLEKTYNNCLRRTEKQNKRVFRNKKLSIVNLDIENYIIKDMEKIITKISFNSFSNMVKTLNLNIENQINVAKTYKYNKEVYKIILTSSMLEKLELKRLFYKNDLTEENNIKFSIYTVENFFNFYNLFTPYNILNKKFLMDSVIILKEVLTKDGKINVIFCNKSTYNLILKLLDLNKLYGKNINDFKGLYNVVNHKTNNNNHYLLTIDNINFNKLYNKNNLNYSLLEEVENYYINLNNLETKEKLKLLKLIKEEEKRRDIDYINNLTYENLKSLYNDYENFNYYNVNMKQYIKTYKEVKINFKRTNRTNKSNKAINEKFINIRSHKLRQLLNILNK